MKYILKMAQECEWVLETMKSTFGLKIDPSWVKINRCSLHFLDKELTFLIATHSYPCKYIHTMIFQIKIKYTIIALNNLD